MAKEYLEYTTEVVCQNIRCRVLSDNETLALDCRNMVGVKYEVNSGNEDRMIFGYTFPVYGGSDNNSYLDDVNSYIATAKGIHGLFQREDLLWDLADDSLMGLAYLRASIKHSTLEYYVTHLPSHKCVIEEMIHVLSTVRKYSEIELEVCAKVQAELEDYVKTLSY